MNTNKHESTEKVVDSILEHTTQMLKTAPLEILKNALSCFEPLASLPICFANYLRCTSAWLKNICVHWCPSVVPNTLSVSSVCSVVKSGGAV